MANYQPNYIYSPLYGNRYMGGSRTPAPSTGGAGQVDTSAIQSRNTAVGVPYTPVVQEEKPLGPIGFSSTGRDQSAVESLSPFGFRDISGITNDPFEGTDYLTNGFGSPSPINTTYIQSVPEPVTVPTVTFGGDGGSNTQTSSGMSSQGGWSSSLEGGQGIAADDSFGMDLGWGLYSYGEKAPFFAPGKALASAVGGAILDSQIDAIDQSFNALDADPTAPSFQSTIDEPAVTISDDYGNVRTVSQSQAEAIQDLSRNEGNTGGFQSDSFGSQAEAEAVASSGFGSDAQFAAIDDQFSSNTENRNDGAVSGGPTSTGATTSTTAASEDIGTPDEDSGGSDSGGK